HFPHSLGLLYSAFTHFCGFKVNSGEYKLMGLAPYGQPVYADLIRRELIEIKEDGSYQLNLEYFGYTRSLEMTTAAFHELFGGPPREPESRITRRHADIAASVQAITEEAVGKLARHLRARSGLRQLCLAGGVALNCVANGRLLRDRVFDDLWIQPAAGDAGGSVGAALMVTHQYYGCPRASTPGRRDGLQGSYLGPAFSTLEVKAYLDSRGCPYREVDDSARARLVAEEIARGNVVGYFVGRMEFGPRALGARSILADPRNPTIQSRLNHNVKHREVFRPFAPSVLRERVGEFFELEGDSPYMLIAAGLRKKLRWTIARVDGDDPISIVDQQRSTLPAITHVDFSARIQTVDARDKPDFHRLLREFEALTGIAVLVNTSFNIRGEPIACSPHDAYRCFMGTNIDILVLENCVLYKHEQPAFEDGKVATTRADAVDPRLVRALTRFYDASLRPLSDTTANAAGSRHDWSPDSGTSCFIPRSRPRLDRSDFELRLDGENETARTLEQAWKASRLRPAVHGLLELASLFQDVEERSDLSSSFYEMF
ncbi:MAG TPA: carbamoyltransferase C-terminal domain-containing protein, partial [Vicinamibacterales bacterium]|nr:carbamoyltransferase C-terminal domain-containing protein [Vicinamibacterales bacterium]